jgi:CRP-like cAMP-binding protein
MEHQPVAPTFPPSELRKIRLFSALGASHLEAIHKASLVLYKAKNAPIILQDSMVLGLHVVLKGQVGIFLRAAATPMVTLDPPSPFGEMSILERTVAAATVRALEDDTVILLVRREAIETLLATDPVFASAIYREIALDLSRKLRLTNAHWESAHP